MGVVVVVTKELLAFWYINIMFIFGSALYISGVLLKMEVGIRKGA